MSETAKWYVIHTYSGYENKVAETIMTVAANRNHTDLILGVYIPTEKVEEITETGRVKEYDRKLLPGYVLVKMILNDDSWYDVRNVRGVTGFVGPGGKAVPLTEKEMRHFGVDKSDDTAAAPDVQKTVSFAVKVGDSVRINDSAMEGFIGTVKSIDEENRTADVSVMWFGRETVTTVDLSKLAVAED